MAGILPLVIKLYHQLNTLKLASKKPAYVNLGEIVAASVLL